jgi:alkylation response protein AidB-like acyl-CoA dehydrogenase
METYPWWTEAQIQLAEEAKRFTDEVLLPLGERSTLTNRFSWEAMKSMAGQGWFGALVPQKYGGRLEQWGVTGRRHPQR